MQPYCCPNCKTNRTRFNMIMQEAQPVKLHPQTGEIVEKYNGGKLDPFHIPYNGAPYRIHCATCGLIENEMTFIQFAKIK